jgi:hypothetical protein
MTWVCRMGNCQIIQELGLQKVRARWILRALSEDHTARRIVSILSFLQQYANRGHDFLEAWYLQTRHEFTMTPWRQNV